MIPDITAASEISGWMTVPELKYLATEASKHKIIVEIGSYLGRSTRAMADNTDGIVYAIDDFKGPRDVVYQNEFDREFIYEEFLRNTRDSKNIVPIVSDHATATVPIIPDMVFIDGGHAFADVDRDIKLWYSRLQNGGLFCGHDIQFDEVCKAVKSNFAAFNVAYGTTIWYLTKGLKESPKAFEAPMIKTLFR